MHRVYLSLGSNLGDRRKNLQEARELLQQQAGSMFALSSLYETESWGFVHENTFYNQVIGILSPQTEKGLLDIILNIEKSMGRTDVKGGYAARIIDIDILFYDDLVTDTNSLRIPHPLIPQRRFVLVPLTEIAPSFQHPVLHMPVSTLLEACTDKMWVKKL